MLRWGGGFVNLCRVFLIKRDCRSTIGHLYISKVDILVWEGTLVF